MSKQRRSTASTGMRSANRKAYVSALKDGRKERATTFTDRKRKASRKACRKGNW